MTALEHAPPTCVECGAPSSPTTGRTIYPHRVDLADRNFWLCPCGAYVGCHLGTQKPLGRPAGPATRTARKAAHRALDPLWQRQARHGREAQQAARLAAYAWLSLQMGRSSHIGEMTAAEARRVVEVCRGLRRIPGGEEKDLAIRTRTDLP